MDVGYNSCKCLYYGKRTVSFSNACGGSLVFGWAWCATGYCLKKNSQEYPKFKTPSCATIVTICEVATCCIFWIVMVLIYVLSYFYLPTFVLVCAEFSTENKRGEFRTLICELKGWCSIYVSSLVVFVF
jgi:hypothetical protein